MPRSMEQKVDDLWRSWFGVEGTDDKGAIHTLHALEDMVPDVQRNTIWRKVLAAALAILIPLVGSLIGINLAS